MGNYVVQRKYLDPLQWSDWDSCYTEEVALRIVKTARINSHGEFRIVRREDTVVEEPAEVLVTADKLAVALRGTFYENGIKTRAARMMEILSADGA